MHKKIKSFLSFFLVSAVLVLGFSFLSSTHEVDAGVSHNVSGYAWSDFIGYISFNNLSDGTGLDYGVSVTPGTGDFSGYAWSPNVGWIDFAPSGPYPEAPNHSARLESNQIVTGWAKVLSMSDGWVKLSDESNPGWAGNGVHLVGNAFRGFAWVPEVLGWIDFAPSTGGVVISTLTTPTVTLSSDLGVVPLGSPVNLSWVVADATSCTASGDWLGSKSAVGGTEMLTPLSLGTKTYTITCTDSINIVNDSVTVDVITPPPYFNLNKTNDVKVGLVVEGGDKTTTESTITAIPFNGFASDIALSVTNPGVIPGAVYNFNADNIIEFGTNAVFSITVPNSTPSGIYTINVQGVGGSYTGSINISVNVSNFSPGYGEF